MNASDLLHALHTPEEDAADSALPQFPGYTVLSQLGRGGSGRVYLARREGSEALVALKHLEHHHSPNDVQRAWRELELLSQLRADCLPRVLDYGHRDGRIFIVTEYIEGLSLTAHCQARKLDRRARAALLAEVAEAVQTLHDHGIIHRDIKPSNVIVDVHGKPIIIDLGIAVLLAHDVMQTLTAEGAPLGSPAFMSPEQARGERSRISIRSDVYSLGATAYLLLTGQTPHDCDVTLHEAVRRVAQEPGRAPRSLDPTIPKPLEAVLQKATAFEPEKRYTTAHAFAEDLHRWMHGDCVQASRSSVWAKVTRWARKHPALASGSIATVILLTALLAVVTTSYYLMRRPFSIALSTDRSSATLLSPTGAVLHEWGGYGPNAFKFAHLVDLRCSGGPIRRVFLGYESHANAHPLYAGELVVVDPKRPDHILWTTGNSAPDILLPEGPLNPSGDRFRIRGVVCADVFPLCEGTEVVTFFNHCSLWPGLVRIYDAMGEVLADAWHHGQISALHIEHRTGRVVVAAVCNEYAWGTLGFPHDPTGLHPHTIAIVSPETLLEQTWLNSHTLQHKRGERYLLLHPSHLASQFAAHVVIQSPLANTVDGRSVAFELTLQLPRIQGAEVTWSFTASGEPIGMRTSSIYDAVENAPDADLLEWCDADALIGISGR